MWINIPVPWIPLGIVDCEWKLCTRFFHRFGSGIFSSSQSLQTALVGCFRKKLHSSPSLLGDLEEKNDPPPDSWRIFVKQKPLLNFIFRKIWQQQNHPASCIRLFKKVRSVCQIVGGGKTPSHHRPTKLGKTRGPLEMESLWYHRGIYPSRRPRW